MEDISDRWEPHGEEWPGTTSRRGGGGQGEAVGTGRQCGRTTVLCECGAVLHSQPRPDHHTQTAHMEARPFGQTISTNNHVPEYERAPDLVGAPMALVESTMMLKMG